MLMVLFFALLKVLLFATSFCHRLLCGGSGRDMNCGDIVISKCTSLSLSLSLSLLFQNAGIKKKT
jgi:hypothetical protein